MTAKTTRTTMVLAMLSFLGLAVPAGLSHTAFAQSIAEDAVSGTSLEGFFDGESNEEEAGDTESQEIDQRQTPQQDQDQREAQDQDQREAQDQDQRQDQDQETSQDESNTQNANLGAGDNTGDIGQNVEGNAVEAADCGDALVCFGNDIVTDADMGQDASVHDNTVDTTATFGNDEAENIGVQNEDQDQDQLEDQDQDQDERQDQDLHQDQIALNVALRLALTGDL